MQLQPRDLSILADLGEYGLLDTATLAARHWGGVASPRACQERLRLLCDEKLIAKTQLLVARINRLGGRIPAVYVLTPKGAEVLELETGHSPERVARSEPSAATLLHRLEMIHARLAIDDAAKREGLTPPQWIYEQDTYDSVTLADPLERRHRLYEKMSWNGVTVTCRPDASCILSVPHATRPTKLIIYWEIDRSTNAPGKEGDKTVGYEALIGLRRFAEHWPDASEQPAVRVFYVCPSEARIMNLAAEIAPHPAAGYYRFAVQATLTPEAALAESIWQDVQGKRYAVLNRPKG